MYSGYHVGIQVQLIDHVSQAMQRISGHLQAAHGHTQAFQQSMAKLQTTMARMSAAQMVGGDLYRGAASALNAMIDPAKEYAQQINAMNLAGLEHLEIQKNIQAAWETSRTVPTSGVTANLSLMEDLRSVVGKEPAHMAEMRNLLPTFKKIEAVIMAATGKPESAEGQILAGVKALDMMGKVTTKEIAIGLENMTKVIQVTHNRVDMQRYQNTVKYLRSMKLTADDDFLYNKLPVFMEEMATRNGSGGGGGPGALFAAFFRTFVQGTMSKKLFENLQFLKLTKGGSLATTTTGTIADHIVGGDLAARDPLKFLEQIWMPAVKNAFPKLANDPQALLLKSMQMMVGNQLSGAIVGEMMNKIGNGQMDRFAAQMKSAPGLDKAYEIANLGPILAPEALHESWNNLMVSIGKVLVPFIPALNLVANALNVVAGFLNANPWAAEMIVLTIATVGFLGGVVALGASIGLTAITLSACAVGFDILGPVIGITVASVSFLVSGFYLLIHTVPRVWESLKTLWDSLTFGVSNTIDFVTKIFQQQLIDPITRGFADVERALKPLVALLPKKVEPVEKAIKKEIATTGSALINFRPSNAKAGNQSSAVLNIAQGAINIVTSEGQSPEQIAKLVMEELAKMAQASFMSGGGFGIINSPALAANGE